MKHLLVVFLFVLSCFASNGQSKISPDLPDSIVINDNSWAFVDAYAYRYVLVKNKSSFTLYQTYQYSRSKKGEKKSSAKKQIGVVTFDKMMALTLALTDTAFSHLRLENFGYNPQVISSKSEEAFETIRNKRDHWTPAQISFAKQQLSNYENYEYAVQRVVGGEGISIVAKDGGTGFDAKFYYPGKTLLVSANENPLGMPWLIDSTKSYNPQIPKLFSEILPSKKTYNKERFEWNKFLFQEFASSIYDDDCERKMNDLAAFEFGDEINDLKTKFEVLSASEYPYGDGYIWGDGQVIKIKLHNTNMLPNLCIDLYLTRKQNTLYTRDSILKKADNLVQTVQNIAFIKDFLLKDTSRKLMIDFENNASINAEVIKGFNGKPEKWKQADWWSAMLKKEDSLGHKQSFNIDESIKTSNQVNCGCNFRLSEDFLKNGIYFIIHDERTNDYSNWIILPDQTIVLWWIQGDGFSNYNYKDLGTSGRGVQYVCKKFTTEGQIAN